MEQLLGTAPIAVSVLFWAVYHYHKDRHLPEPLGHLAVAFALGALAVYISSLLYAGLGLIGLRFDAGYLAETSSRALLAYSLLAIGPIEELAKMLPFLVVIIRFKEFDEPMDGIIYASFIGLGYAAVENWQYLEYLTTVEAIARGFASPVIHMLFASIWGHWIARAHLEGRSIFRGTRQFRHSSSTARSVRLCCDPQSAPRAADCGIRDYCDLVMAPAGTARHAQGRVSGPLTTEQVESPGVFDSWLFES